MISFHSKSLHWTRITMKKKKKNLLKICLFSFHWEFSKKKVIQYKKYHKAQMTQGLIGCQMMLLSTLQNLKFSISRLWRIHSYAYLLILFCAFYLTTKTYRQSDSIVWKWSKLHTLPFQNITDTPFQSLG